MLLDLWWERGCRPQMQEQVKEHSKRLTVPGLFESSYTPHFEIQSNCEGFVLSVGFEYTNNIWLVLWKYPFGALRVRPPPLSPPPCAYILPWQHSAAAAARVVLQRQSWSRGWDGEGTPRSSLWHIPSPCRSVCFPLGCTALPARCGPAPRSVMGGWGSVRRYWAGRP